MCRRRGLKVNTGKSKVMVLNGEEELEHEVHLDCIHLEHVSEFKCLGCVWANQAQMGVECNRKVVVVTSAVTSLVNARDVQLESARVLNETLLMPVLMYGSETMI